MERSNSSAASRINVHGGNGRAGIEMSDDQSIADLFKRLTADSSYLMRQEINLAKTELRESATRLSRTATKLAIALGLAIPGALAIAAFLVIALGDAINNYWASALIVGVVLLGLAGVLAQRGLAAVSKGKLGLPDTTKTLRDDARWAKEEVRTFKREVSA